MTSAPMSAARTTKRMMVVITAVLLTTLGLAGAPVSAEVPPTVSELRVVPTPAAPFAPVEVTALVADATSIISGATLTFGVTNVTMTPVDGAYDETVEEVRTTMSASGIEGSYPVCVFARDASGVESAVVCTTLVVRTEIVLDTQAPVVTAVAAAPEGVPLGEPVTVTATGDDRSTGGSDVSLELSVDGTTWAPMTPDDGAFDSSLEAATATTAYATVGFKAILVRASDSVGNVGGLWSVAVLAFEPSGVVVANGVLADGRQDLTVHLSARYDKAGRPVGSLAIVGQDIDIRATAITAMAIGDREASVWADAIINGSPGRVRIGLTDQRAGDTLGFGAVLDDHRIVLITSGTLRYGAVTIRR